VTAVSDSLAQGELEEAEALARRIGIRHRVIRTEEFADPNYVRNNPDRCYFCKSELYGRLEGLLGVLDVDAIASGANTDDAGDYRPGMRAAAEHGVRHPLQECGLGKAEVRALARAWVLPTWDKPATPCLSAGSPTARRSPRAGPHDRRGRAVAPPPRPAPAPRPVSQGRPRPRRGPVEELAGLAAPGVRDELVAAFRGFGFKFVTLDLEGSGPGA
jgi:uncharacterized protein